MGTIPLPHRPGAAPMMPFFAAEKTLGKLAKWLRLLGFDTLYEPGIATEEFIKSLESDRILLTRTQRIQKQSLSCKLIFVQSDHWIAQLKQLIIELNLTAHDARPFSRCLQCNEPIVATDKDSLRGRVPDYIFETQEQFRRCPKCDNIYWPGTHTKRSMQKIKQVFNECPSENDMA
jgi:uncharacterized protein with PIN domain